MEDHFLLGDQDFSLLYPLLDNYDTQFMIGHAFFFRSCFLPVHLTSYATIGRPRYLYCSSDLFPHP